MQLFIRDSAINKYMTSKFDSFCNIFLSEAPVPPAPTTASTTASTTAPTTAPTTATTNTQNANSTPPASAASQQTDAMKRVMVSLVTANNVDAVEAALTSHGFMLTPANATNKPA